MASNYRISSGIVILTLYTLISNAMEGLNEREISLPNGNRFWHFKKYQKSFICEEQKPNIILMNMDDMGWGDLGVFGEPNKETPNLDQMAREGMTLTSFYTAAPLCSPSRAAMLSGRLPIRNGFYSDNKLGRNAYTPQDIMGGIATEEALLPQLLQKNNYRTKLIGKWHLGHLPAYHPMNHGFGEFFGSPNCHFDEHPYAPIYKNKQMIGRYYEQQFDINTILHISNYTQMIKAEALAYIAKRAWTKKPFFLYWAPDSTHAPVYSSLKFRGQSRRGAYGDAIIELDDSVGEILALIRKLKIEQNTLVIFTSDNGAALISKEMGGSNGRLLCGKQTTFEGGFRVPAIFWWPTVINGGVTSQQVGTQMDLFTTILSITGSKGFPTDRKIDGLDLTPILLQKAEEFERSVFYYRGNLLMAFRYGAYKLHLWTWATPDKYNQGGGFCPGQYSEGLTTNVQVDHSKNPILFQLERDPGEKYAIGNQTEEYRTSVPKMLDIIKKHKGELVKGKAELNWYNEAVKNWAPPGCEKLHPPSCFKPPKSRAFKCDWDH